jgi:outer membrane immunogenic protein
MLRIHSLAALAIFALPAVASAADRSPLAPSPAVYTAPSAWNGPHVGVIGGLGWAEARDTRWIGGLYAGYNVGFGSNMVFGFEADGTVNSTSIETSATKVQNPWDSTVRARIGYGDSNALLYATAGLAFGSVKETKAAVTESTAKTGWTAGLGVEAILRTNATARLEYRYTSFGTVSFSSNPPVAYRSNDLLVGLDLKLF